MGRKCFFGKLSCQNRLGFCVRVVVSLLLSPLEVWEWVVRNNEKETNEKQFLRILVTNKSHFLRILVRNEHPNKSAQKGFSFGL